MAAFKNKDNGTWYVQFRYTDWKGERQQKLKRGFATKREALEWEREFLMEKQADVNMTFESFVAPVSYTHLDVYKRQGVARGIRAPKFHPGGLTARGRNPDQRRAVAGRPGQIAGRLIAGHQALIAVDQGIGDGRHGAHMRKRCV